MDANLNSLIPENIPSSAKLFLTAVIFQGIANGIFNVVLQLYFTSLGFSGSTLGSIFMMNALSAAILTLPMGILADRVGKRKLLLVGLLMVTIGTIIFLGTQSPLMIMFSFLCIGVASATSVVLSPLYSSFFVDSDMDKAFSLWMSLGVVTSSLGSLFGYIPPFLVNIFGMTFQRAYWILMAIGTVFFVSPFIFFIISAKRDETEPPRKGASLILTSKGLVLKFSLLGFFISAAFGVFLSLFPFYVNQKLGIHSDSLGTLMFLSSFASAAAQIAAPKISEKFGSVITIALVIGLSAPLYMLMSFASSFTILSALYLLRLSLVSLSQPLISSTYMKNLAEEEKSTATKLNIKFHSNHVHAPRKRRGAVVGRTAYGDSISWVPSVTWWRINCCNGCVHIISA
jgi:MFS family permease